MTLSPLFAFSMYLQLPLLIVVISLVYSATRHDDWPGILQEAFRWGLRMAFFLGMIAGNIFILVTVPFWAFLVILGGQLVVFLVYMMFHSK